MQCHPDFLRVIAAEPHEPPSFQHLTPEGVLAETDEILQTTLKLHNKLIATITPASATFDNIIRPIVDDENRAKCRLTILSDLLAQLSPDKDIRKAARQAGRDIEAARVRNLMRYDVAGLILAVHANEADKPSQNLDAQDRHLLSCMYGKYVRSGASLRNREERERFGQASNELSDLCAAAQDTLIEPEQGAWFENADLAGVPEDVLATMIRNGSKVQVTFQKHHVAAVYRHATNSDTRRRLMVANWHRLPENVKRLSRVIALRDEIARLLGFEHHAALKFESRMALSVAHVSTQLEDLHKELKPVAQVETDRLAHYKRSAAAAANATVDALDDHERHRVEFYEWDKAFYSHKQKQNESSADVSHFAEYFEAIHTFQAMLTLFHDLFGLMFKPITPTTWHESVLAFQVWDTPSEGGGFLGYLYVDLFEREGKYRGAHCVGIQPGFIESSGRRHYPITVLVCCYAKPAEPVPTLLQHNEIKTMFHELGHAIHHLVSRTKYGLPWSRDYSEIPSIMLENWIWVPDVLIRIGRHHTTLNNNTESNSGVMPCDLAEAVCARKYSNKANAILGQVWPALFDLAIHSPPRHAAALEMDTTDIWNMTKQRVITTSCGHDPQDWGAGQARFIHMFRHNDAGYFSYPLSIAYAADLFASAFAHDPMSAEAGRRWRYQVLEPGASRPEMGILKDFLGREPSINTILSELKTS